MLEKRIIPCLYVRNGEEGAVGIILGRARLFEGKFTLTEAISCWQNA